jgi:hypothetical protein
MRAFQREFVRKGNNKKAHYSILPKVPLILSPRQLESMPIEQQKNTMNRTKARLEQLDDFFGGGIVPVVIRDDYVAMAGMTSKKNAPDALQFLAEQINSQKSVAESVKQMRFIEARRSPDESKTMISAVWSDDELDMLKFAPDAKRSDLAVSTRIPACLGCRRVMNFQGQGAERDYGTNVFVGQQNVADTIAFYDRAMRARGWKLSGASQTMRLLSARGVIPPNAARMTSFSKNGKFITVMAYPVDRGGRTQVHVFDSP